jgi:tetratricopeptide (TPR) repeat protein
VPPSRPTPPTPIEIQRLIAAGDMVGALRVADALIAQSQRSLPGWLGKGCALLNLGHLGEADAALTQALRLAPTDPQAHLLLGMVEQRLGRIDAAVERLSKIADGKSPQAIEAAITLMEVLWFAHRRDQLAAWFAKGGAWASDPRAQLTQARLRGVSDPARAIDDLRGLATVARSPVVRRVAGFDAVGLLDRSGRYREAFDLATQLHAQLTPRFDVEGMLLEVKEQEAMLAKGANWITPRVDRVANVALVVGLPRSGTTLLEQMLDRHPEISGIGEYEGIDRLMGDLISIGAWPRRVSALSRDTATTMAERYLDGARRLARPQTRYTFDKTLRAWRFLPAVAAILPGAVCLRVARDPRDAAISTFLSYFHPVTDGWTASLSSLRRVHEHERAILPKAMEVLQLPHVSLVYEQFVETPRAHIERVLACLGLPMEGAVLTPEANTRAVFTLSHEQVRKPIHRASIGRWKNYEFAFDGSWDALVATHASECSQP